MWSSKSNGNYDVNCFFFCVGGGGGGGDCGLRVCNKEASKGSCFDELFAGRFQVWSIGIF